MVIASLLDTRLSGYLSVSSAQQHISSTYSQATGRVAGDRGPVRQVSCGEHDQPVQPPFIADDRSDPGVRFPGSPRTLASRLDIWLSMAVHPFAETPDTFI